MDPACGSGAFLIAAFDRLAAAYRECDRQLRALSDGPPRLGFDVDREVLRRNLYGVDLNGEAVEGLPPVAVDQDGGARQAAHHARGSRLRRGQPYRV